MGALATFASRNRVLASSRQVNFLVSSAGGVVAGCCPPSSRGWWDSGRLDQSSQHDDCHGCFDESVSGLVSGRGRKPVTPRRGHHPKASQTATLEIETISASGAAVFCRPSKLLQRRCRKLRHQMSQDDRVGGSPEAFEQRQRGHSGLCNPSVGPHAVLRELVRLPRQRLDVVTMIMFRKPWHSLDRADCWVNIFIDGSPQR